MSVEDVMKRTGPRKLLALDGGGIRGVISIRVLERVEALLRTALKRDASFRLSHYFDYIAGTSTGAIIATLLSMGKSVAEIRDFYTRSGADMFNRASFLERLASYKFEARELGAMLRDIIGEQETLGSAKLETLLLLVMHNATTDSPWPVSNNPQAKYNLAARRTSGKHDCNLDLPLWRLVRASTAAPTFFPPEQVVIGEQEFVFVDGGITPFNNPALQLFLMATLEPYALRWPAGEDKMLVVSVGTGSTVKAKADLKPGEMHKLHSAVTVPANLMSGAAAQQDALCRVLGRCRVGEEIDREVGDLMAAAGPVTPRLFTYLRYNVALTDVGLGKIGITDIDPAHLQEMDSVEHVGEMINVGLALARERVRIEHFEGFLH